MHRLCPLEKASSLGHAAGVLCPPTSLRLCSDLLAGDSGWVDEFGLTLPPRPHKPASPAGEVIAP